ncbi:hypothetical protein Tco_0296536 [Tanacetum coccineum]
MKTKLARKTSLKKKGVHKEYVSKQGRKSVKSFKGEPFVHKDPAFDDLDDFMDVDDTLDYMETEDDQNEGRTSSVVLEEKESAYKEVSIEAPKGTDKKNEGTDKKDGGTDNTKVSTDRQGEGTPDQNEGKRATQTAPTTTSTPTPTTPTPIVFGDDETIVQVLIITSQNKEKLKEKEKGVEIRNVKETERPRPTSTRSICTDNQNHKKTVKTGKHGHEERKSTKEARDAKPKAGKSKSQSSNGRRAKKGRASHDNHCAYPMDKLELGKTKEVSFRIVKIDPKDKGKKRIEEEDESDTESEGITEAEKKFKQLANDEEVARKVQEESKAKEEKKRLAEEEATKAALSNEYDFIQARLNAVTNTAAETQEKIKRSKRNEKVIKEMNKQAADASKKRVKKDDSVKGEIKEEEGARKRKLGTRKKMKSKKRKFTSKDDEELRLCLTIAPDKDKEVDYEILDKKYHIIKWRSKYLTTKPQYDETEEIEDVYLNVVIRSNNKEDTSSTLMQSSSPYLIEMTINLIIMFNQSGNDEFWNAQQNWKIVSWKLHSSSGIHTIMTDEGIVIHMLVENKYPLKKEVLSQLLKLKLETEEDSTMALELIRFVKKQIAELEPEDSDGDEKDL